MSISEELHRLAEMHRDGVLTDDEFTTAKQHLLANNQRAPFDETTAPQPRAHGDQGDQGDQGHAVEPSHQEPGTESNFSGAAAKEADDAQPEVLLEESGYVVTSRQIFAPSGKVYTVAQIVSCDIQRRQNEVKETINHGRTAKAETYRVLAWLSVLVFLVFAFAFPEHDGVLVPGLALLTSIALFAKSAPTRGEEAVVKTDFRVKVRTTNMTQSEVLITTDEEFAIRLYSAVVAAIE